MGLINNKDLYPEDKKISLKDSLIGSDFDKDEDGSTKNYSVGEVYDFINGLNNKKAASYIYSSTDADAKEGVFNITGAIFKFNEKDSRGIDNSLFFRELKSNKNHVRLSLSSDINSFNYFKIVNVTQNLNTFSFELISIGTTDVTSFLIEGVYNLSIDIIEESSGASSQTDWNETSATSADFLKNKPTTISSGQASAIVSNTAKVGLTPAQITTLSNTIGVNTGDQDISGITTNASAISNIETAQITQNLAIALNTAKTGITNSQTTKLAGLESSKFLGEYPTEPALLLAYPSPPAGSYAYVDTGVGRDVLKYIWDTSDNKYIKQLGASTAETPATIKTKLLSNPNTENFSTAEKTKLANIEVDAEVNLVETASNGLTLNGLNVELGGNLTKDTEIDLNSNDLKILGNGTSSFATNVVIDSEGSNTNIANSIFTVKKTSSANSGTQVTQFIDAIRNSSTNSTGTTYGSVVRATDSTNGTSSGVIALNAVGTYDGDGGATESYGVVSQSSHKGSGDMNQLIGTFTHAVVDNVGSTNIQFATALSGRSELIGNVVTNVDYLRGHDLQARIDNPNATVKWLQGAHPGVDIKAGTITEDVQVVFLDVDIDTANSANIDIQGNLSYLVGGGGSDVINAAVGGKKRFIWNQGGFESDFGGVINYTGDVSNITNATNKALINKEFADNNYLKLSGGTITEDLTATEILARNTADEVVKMPISNITDGYLPLTGGTLTGDLRIIDSQLRISSSVYDSYIISSSNAGFALYNIDENSINFRVLGKEVIVPGSGAFKVGANTVYHEGNKQKGFDVLATAPISPTAGDVYYDSTTNKARCWNGTIWNNLF